MLTVVVQGQDLEMATTCLCPFLLNCVLEPILVRTAQKASTAPNSVRIIWVFSMITASVPPGGIRFEDKNGKPQVLKNAMQNYMQSKVGNVFLASEAAKRLGGRVNVVQELQRCSEAGARRRPSFHCKPQRVT